METNGRLRIGGRLVLPLLAIIAGYLAGCGDLQHRVEKSIAESLPAKIGPARSYDVRVSGSTLGILRGTIGGVRITGQEVQLKNGLLVQQLDVAIKDICFDSGTHAITKCGKTDYSATLSPTELLNYLAKSYPDVPELSVNLCDGYLGVCAAPEITRVKVRIKAEATLDIDRQRLLMLNLKKITAAGLPAPGFARDYISKKFNPIFDATSLGFDARISSVRIAPGGLTLFGNLDLASALSK